MEVLMDYHLFFMAVAFCLLLITFVFIYIIKTKESIIGGMLLAGINYVICLICSLGFFGIGIIGIDSSGAASITANHDMYSFYAIFFMLYWLNIVLMIYCAMLLLKNPCMLDKAELD